MIADLASPQPSLGVRSSRIHFSPEPQKDVCGEAIGDCDLIGHRSQSARQRPGRVDNRFHLKLYFSTIVLL